MLGWPSDAWLRGGSLMFFFFFGGWGVILLLLKAAPTAKPLLCLVLREIREREREGPNQRGRGGGLGEKFRVDGLMSGFRLSSRARPPFDSFNLVFFFFCI